MKLRTKLTTIFLLISFIPLTLCSSVLLLSTLKSNNTSVYQYFNTFCDNSATKVSAFFKDKQTSITTLSRFSNVSNHEWETASLPLHEVVATGMFEKIILARKDGTYFNTGGGNPYFNGMQTSDNKSPTAKKSSIAIRDYFKDMVTNNPTEKSLSKVSEPVISLSNGIRQIMVCQTVFNYDNKLNGMLAGAVSWSIFEQELNQIKQQAFSTFGTDIKILIVNRNGSVVYHWDENKVVRLEKVDGQNTSVTTTIKELDPVFSDYAEQMSTLREDFEPVDLRLNGERTIFSFTPIAGTNMALGIFIPRSPLFATLRGQLWTSLVLIGFTVLLVCIIALYFSKRTIRPLIKIASLLGQLASGGGDLTIRLPIKNNDVISDISGNFNRFADTLRGIIGSIQKEADTLGNVSADLNKDVLETKNAVDTIGSKTGDLSENAINLSASIEETTSTVHEIAKTIESLNTQISSQSQSVNESSAAIEEMVANIQSVSTNLSRASETFEELKNDSESGRTTMEAVIESVKATAQHSQQLLEANDMIEAIATQTNLLAMNAAIEAAHAGDAGKGFSVVADEIRKLAEDSSDQSKKIADMLRIVVSNIETVVGQSGSANTAFEKISSQISSANDLMTEVSMSMNEQSEGSQQVLESLRSMQNITSQILNGSTEMTTGANMIQKEMLHLRDFAYQVKDVTQAVSDHITDINQSVASVSSLSNKNNELSDSLLAQTKGFKL